MLSWAWLQRCLLHTSFAGVDEKTESMDVERITVDDLKSKFAKNEQVVVLDVRGGDYDASPTKIKGAIRIAPGQIESHLKDIPRDKEIVTYCACATDGGSVKAALAASLQRVHTSPGAQGRLDCMDPGEWSGRAEVAAILKQAGANGAAAPGCTRG